MVILPTNLATVQRATISEVSLSLLMFFDAGLIAYTRATRRRHGIPDSDHRPFNVAYAAALRARQEREAEGTGRGRRAGVQPLSQKQASSTDGQGIRQRLNHSGMHVALVCRIHTNASATDTYPSVLSTTSTIPMIGALPPDRPSDRARRSGDDYPYVFSLLMSLCYIIDD